MVIKLLSALLQRLMRTHPKRNTQCRYTMGRPTSGSGFRPCILAVRDHLVDSFLRDLHGLHASRRAAVDSRLKHNLSDLDLCEAIVDGTAGVQCKLKPRLLGDDYSQICSTWETQHWSAGFAHLPP